jgi:hypothetical protein
MRARRAAETKNRGAVCSIDGDFFHALLRSSDASSLRVSQQVAPGHAQIGQRTAHLQTVQILGQAPIAHLGLVGILAPLDERRGDCPKAAEAGFVVAHDVAGFERNAFRENPFISAVFGS